MEQVKKKSGTSEDKMLNRFKKSGIFEEKSGTGEDSVYRNVENHTSVHSWKYQMSFRKYKKN